MTVEAIGPAGACRVTVERGNGDHIQALALSLQERGGLLTLLEMFNLGHSPAAHLEFKEIGERPTW
jgi:hypothetical protein